LTEPVRIRAARREDVAVVFALIVELANYERAAHEVTGDAELLEAAMFGPDPSVEVVVAELGGEVVGFAQYFRTFSTWLCRPGLWLEDLYVSPAHRRGGVGRALLAHLAAIVVERDYGRLEWAALRWNGLALGFYDALGAERLEEWQTLRLDGAALRALAASRSR
jgi:GNAT superfamily N-acetyltransferase